MLGCLTQRTVRVSRGWQGLLAYSCNYTVVVVDPLTQQLVQTLDKHKALVTKVIHVLQSGVVTKVCNVEYSIEDTLTMAT